jgi:tetratricopeptide (TPR) repeat protein
MYSKKNWSSYKISIRRKRLVFAVIMMAVIGGVTAASVHFAGRLRGSVGGGRRELLELWDGGDYEAVYSRSRDALAARPMDYFFLSMRGFSAYQIGVSQINSLNAAQYFDDCVWSLRKALLLKNAENDGRLHYVLGKAYRYKGDSYADLSVKYLEKARELSFAVADIPQYLGIAYAAIGDYRSSVAAYSEALGSLEDGPSSLLPSAIARADLALEEFDAARAYLLRCIEISADSRAILEARLLLTEVLRNSGDNEGARRQLQEIIDETGDNAEVRFQMGELYALQGDTARARAEWRLALRADPAHAKARTRLSI